MSTLKIVYIYSKLKHNIWSNLVDFGSKFIRFVFLSVTSGRVRIVYHVGSGFPSLNARALLTVIGGLPEVWRALGLREPSASLSLAGFFFP